MKHQKIEKNIFNLIVIVGMLAGIVFAFPGASQARASEQAKITTSPSHSLPESETGLYIIQLIDPSVSRYMGGISGLQATSPQATGVRRLDASTPASQAYLEYLSSQQQAMVDSLQSILGHSIEVQFYYRAAMNAIAVRISHDEALQAFNLSGVKTVYADQLNELDTDMGPTLIGAPSIWEGDTIGGIATKGEGIVIGMIDSGINHAHPSFAEVGPKDGHIFENPYGANNFHGYCADNEGFCNNKLIGAYGLNPLGGIPEDTDGHGSHTSSTAGGNYVDATVNVGGVEFTRAISGVAPWANIVAYKVCNPSCPTSASIAAVDHAILDDGVDVINYSISGGDSPWTDPVDLAFLDAFAAGIFVSASAGNNGPTPGSVAHTGPWNSSVAASTHSRVIANTVDVTSESGSRTGVYAVPGQDVTVLSEFTYPILWAGEVDSNNYLACQPFSGTPFTGKIGLAQRGTGGDSNCTFGVKVNNLHNAGAVAVIIYNNVGGPPITMGHDTNPFPVSAEMIPIEDGLAIVELINGDPAASAVTHADLQVVIKPEWQDIMAGFSSQGPSSFDLLKPDYTAPGVNILAAVAASGGDPVQYDFLQGTSMSSPHSAGSAALMMALRPDWTVAEIRSAMNSTADPLPVKDPNGFDPANPLEMGSGRLNLFAAANTGLVMDETTENYVAANPASGGDPKTLNQPSMVNRQCGGICTWTRTVKSVLPVEDTWTISVTSDPNLVLSVTPSEFTLGPGESAVLEITADASAAGLGETLFGDIELSPSTALLTHLPVYIVNTAPPVISVDPQEIVNIQPPELAIVPLAISNLGISDLEWNLYDGSTAPTSWSDNFDSYITGSQMHGQGGWKGWANNPDAGALVSDAEAKSSPNSVAIVGASDLVHEYAGYTTGEWVYTAWQFLPQDFSGQTSFILLNQYTDEGSTNNWSTQITFDSTTGNVSNDGPAGGTLPLILGEWVQIRVEINLNTDVQSFFYGDQLLFTGSWKDGMSGGGIANIAAVDLFANNASVVYYDDISLALGGEPACGVWGDIPWLSTDPTHGITPQGETTPVDVLLDGTGMAPGDYSAELCAASNDPVTPLVHIPVTMRIRPVIDLSINKTDTPDPVLAGDPLKYTLTISNPGPAEAAGVVVTDTLPGGVTFTGASEGCAAADGVVICDLGTLPVEEKAITITVSAPVTPGLITNTALLSGDVIDEDLSNNTAEATTVVEAKAADLSLTKTASTDALRVGELLTYTLVASNVGPQVATGVLVTDSLPSQVSFASSSACVEATSGSLVCDLSDLEVDGVITFTVVVTAESQGVALNTAQVMSDLPDPDLTNNTATASVTIAPENFFILMPIIQNH